MLFNDQRDNEADQSQSLAEGGAHDEDGEHAALDLRPVSYTHLDVYKRQARHGSHGRRRRYARNRCP